jgi:hypothetical protein
MHLSVASRVLVALLATAALPILFQPAAAADKRPGASIALKPAPQPSGAELVGKLLNEANGPSDPDVPLPQRGLSPSQNPASAPLSGPQVFGRQEDNGGVFGLKFPIPVTRSSN